MSQNNEAHHAAAAAGPAGRDPARAQGLGPLMVTGPAVRVRNARGFRKRAMWQFAETNALANGVKIYGEGSWAEIVRADEFIPNGRTNGDLQSKWTKLKKAYSRGVAAGMGQVDLMAETMLTAANLEVLRLAVIGIAPAALAPEDVE